MTIIGLYSTDVKFLPKSEGGMLNEDFYYWFWLLIAVIFFCFAGTFLKNLTF